MKKQTEKILNWLKINYIKVILAIVSTAILFCSFNLSINKKTGQISCSKSTPELNVDIKK